MSETTRGSPLQQGFSIEGMGRTETERIVSTPNSGTLIDPNVFDHNASSVTISPEDYDYANSLPYSQQMAEINQLSRELHRLLVERFNDRPSHYINSWVFRSGSELLSFTGHVILEYETDGMRVLKRSTSSIAVNPPSNIFDDPSVRLKFYTYNEPEHTALYQSEIALNEINENSVREYAWRFIVILMAALRFLTNKH